MIEKIESFCLNILEKIHLKKIADLYRDNISVMRYLIFGVLTTIINIVIYALCYNILNIPNLISNTIAWFISVTVAYLTNRKSVFNSNANTKKEVLVEIIRFFVSRLATLALDQAIMFITVEKFGWNSILMKVISNIIVIIANFVLSKLVVFKNGGSDGKMV